MSHPDSRYVEALLRHEEPVLKEMYKRFSPAIIHHVVKNSGTEADGKDIFQEGLVAVYQRALKGGFVLHVNFESYLLAVCRNLWLMQLRKKASHKVTFPGTLQYETEADVFGEAEHIANTHARQLLIEEKMNEVGESCQKVLRLSLGGMPLEEVARNMNTTYAYIRKKKSECVNRLMNLVRQSQQFEYLKW
jgi:RNA polymerase sigma factor (sigma-70 family)